jgi:outer membrane protein TolC
MAPLALLLILAPRASMALQSLELFAAGARERNPAALEQAAAQARSRYAVGNIAQLDLLQAQRDAFIADVNRIQADADLANARAQLRLASGRSLVESTNERNALP